MKNIDDNTLKLKMIPSLFVLLVGAGFLYVSYNEAVKSTIYESVVCNRNENICVITEQNLFKKDRTTTIAVDDIVGCRCDVHQASKTRAEIKTYYFLYETCYFYDKNNQKYYVGPNKTYGFNKIGWKVRNNYQEFKKLYDDLIGANHHCKEMAEKLKQSGAYTVIVYENSDQKSRRSEIIGISLMMFALGFMFVIPALLLIYQNAVKTKPNNKDTVNILIK